MTSITAIGKYLDQPILTAKINKSVPYILAGGSAVCLTSVINKSPEREKKKNGLKTGIILLSTALSAILAPRIASKISGRNATKTFEEIKTYNKSVIDEHLTATKSENKKILEKAKSEILSLGEVKKLFNSKKDRTIAEQLIPPPENISSKDIFKEIGWLSIYGAVPVIGGITGGITADRLTENNWKEKMPDKINEGIYQYLANIFLCNIGAGIALGILEKLNIRSKTARCVGMVAGILLTGVIGGSLIANYIGNKFINPIVLKNKKEELRTPELLDLSLHSDDIATVSLLSGLKWIEPSLPLLYSVSGYRAGIGYRNHRSN